MMYWILDDQHRLLAASEEEWGTFFENIRNRRVAMTEVFGELTVSTVFLGIAHGFRDHQPLVFETLVLGPGGETSDMDRCCTWDEALASHKRMVEQLQLARTLQ